MRRFTLIIILILAIIPGIAGAASFSEEHAGKLRTLILSLINESRDADGLPALLPHEGIQKVAQMHVEDTVAHFDPASPESREKSYLAHTSSDGRSLNARYRDAGVETGWEFAENAGYWTRSRFGDTLDAATYGLKTIHEGMMAEVPPNDGHRRNVLGHFTHIGIGLALLNPEDSDMNAVFLVTNFSFYGSREEAEKAEEARLVSGPTSPRSLPRSPLPLHGGPFTDIAPEHAYAMAIRSLKDKDILQGYPDGTFQPGKNVNRAEFLKMLLDAKSFSPIGREFNECFTDVFNQWFAPYVCVAKREGWVKGYPDKTFRPETPVSRAEAITLMARIFSPERENASPILFDDVPPDAWFADALQSLAGKNVLPFSSMRFLPEKEMTRGEVAEMIYREIKVQ